MSVAHRPQEGSTRLVDEVGLRRIVTRLAHEVVERHPGLDGLVVAGIRQGGVRVAEMVHGALRELTGTSLPLGALDVSAYRDDRPRPRARPRRVWSALGGGGGDAEDGPPVAGAVVILADDVVHTGRTLRAALDAIAVQGRPAAVEPLVLIDRGHRELPLRATYVGRNVPVPSSAWVTVTRRPPAPAEEVWLIPR